MRMLLAIATLGPGGAERVITILADAFAARGHEVTLLTLDSGRDDFFRVSQSVQRIALGRHGQSHSVIEGLRENVRRIRDMRRAVERVGPEVVVSFVTEMNVLMLLACVGRRSPVLISERVDPRIHPVGRAWDWLRWVAYRRAAGLVVQTDAVAEWLAATHRRLPPITVIPNPVPRRDVRGPHHSHNDRAYLLAAGRLAVQKGFDLLLLAMAVMVRQGVDLDLVIVGEGAEEGALRHLASELGLAERVRFVGRVVDLSPWMQGAFAFVLPSRYEGFPNVLLEALACGTPTIAADCSSGPKEILENGKHGLLVPCEDPAAIARAVSALQEDPQLHARLRAQGPKATERFAVSAIATQWEVLMQRATSW